MRTCTNRGWARLPTTTTGRVPRTLLHTRGSSSSPAAFRATTIATTEAVCVQSGLSDLFNYSAIQRVWGMCRQTHKEDLCVFDELNRYWIRHIEGVMVRHLIENEGVDLDLE